MRGPPRRTSSQTRLFETGRAVRGRGVEGAPGTASSRLPRSKPGPPVPSVTHRVPRPLSRDHPAAAISRAAYAKAGIQLSSVDGGHGGRRGQHRSGGRHGKGDRPSDTRRDTWINLGPGMLRAMRGYILAMGFDLCARRLHKRPLAGEVRDSLCASLRERSDEFYGREVWVLKHAFGVLSRYFNVIND